MRFFHFLINTNIFISLSAVALTLATQVQLGMAPQFHPYLFIIFFATIFEYNLHRLVTVIKNPQALGDDKHKWVKDSPAAFYLLVALSVIGFGIAVLFAQKQVLITLFPIGLLTLLYSLPLLKVNKILFRLREIPFVKIFLISMVWSAATILLPLIQSDKTFDRLHIMIMLIERFLFVFAITVPFDIRDMEADRSAGLKTIPLVIGEKSALRLALGLLVVFTIVCFVHYGMRHQAFLIPAFLFSALSTGYFLISKRLQKINHYHYFVLDGTMMLQGLLVCCASMLNEII